MVSGVIITSYGRWKIGDIGRAGNYINLFNPEGKGIFYYSHLDSVFVKAGDIVKAGDVIGFVGRTGRKAVFGKTHIHIGYYKITDGYPQPVDIINEFINAEKRYRETKKNKPFHTDVFGERVNHDMDYFIRTIFFV